MATILIVEDEADIRALSRSILELLGHRVDEAESGERALLYLRRRRYDLVLTDLGLPGMDGWAVARVAKQLAPHAKVGLVTGWEVPPPDPMPAKSVDFLLPKPFALDELEQALAKVAL